jgi:ABC-type nitrate/sulfonate/bicarbonate transport system substrate-binding protein
MAMVANMAIVTFLVSVRRLRPIRIAAALLCLVALAGTMPAQAGTPLHLTLDRKIDGTMAPLFLAVDQGAFKDEGLDVTIDVAAGGSAEVFDRLASAKSDLAVSDLNLLIKFRDATGTPIKAVFTVFDKPPYAIIARKSRGVAAPRDLQGRKLGASATDPTFAVWPTFASVAGIDAAKVAVEQLGSPSPASRSFRMSILKPAACHPTISPYCRWRLMASCSTATPSWSRRLSPRENPTRCGHSCALMCGP